MIEQGTFNLEEFEDEITRAATNHRIGTRMLLENDRVRIWEIRLDPGERVPFHTHSRPYLFVCVDGGRQIGRRVDGSYRLVEMPVGFTYWSNLSDGPEVHSIENVGTTTIRYTTVELCDEGSG